MRYRDYNYFTFFLLDFAFKIHSLVSIVGVVLNGKENYSESSKNIENTLIFNYIWDGIDDGYTSPIKPIVVKEIGIWMDKDKKAYALIIASWINIWNLLLKCCISVT
jgi:hypothetical protein